MRFPHREVVEDVRRKYPRGTRVELIWMDDAQAPPAGTKGTIVGVDDTASLMVAWDNGSHLNVVYGEDEVRKVTERRDASESRRDRILDGIKFVQWLGLTNMFDAQMVQRLAFDHGYYELVNFIEEHRKEYAHLILKGEFPKGFEP